MARYINGFGAKKWFKQLTSTGSGARDQRKEGAKGLVQLIEISSSGGQTVLRQFMKSDERLKRGLSGVLRLLDEEAEASDTDPDSAAAPKLLQPLQQNLNLFHSLIPSHLISGSTYGATGVRYLVHSTDDSRVPSSKEITSILRFTAHILRSSAPHSSWQSVHAISLLECVVRYHAELVKTALNNAADSLLPMDLFGIAWMMVWGRRDVDVHLQRRCRFAVMQFIRTVHANIRTPINSILPMTLIAQGRAA